VKLQTGATGFAAHDGEKTQAKKHWHLGPGSGRADLRGQHQGPKSAFGLVFNN
jgi:nitric oxide synthase-interacting protein